MESNHVLALVREFSTMADIYLATHEDADLNDVLSALASMLVANCKDHDVTRTELLRNINLTFDEVSTRLDS